MEDAEIESMLRRFYPSAKVLRHHKRNPTRDEEEKIAAKLLELSRKHGENDGRIRCEFDAWCREQGL